MTKSIAIIYSSTDGHTKTICDKVQEVISDSARSESSVNSDIVLIDSIDSIQKPIESYDMVVIIASIRYGKHNKLVSKFINENRALLESRPTAFCSVNLVARKPEKCSPETNPYFKKFMDEIKWEPTIKMVLGGQLDYARYSWFDRFMIRLIMRITDGPLKSDKPIIFTDWSMVDKFAKEISETVTVTVTE